MATFLLQKGFIVFGIVRPESNNIKNAEKIENLKLIELNFDNLSSNDFINILDENNKKSIDVVDDIKKLNADISFIHFAWGATASVGSQASSSTDTTLHNYAQLSSSLVKTSNGNNYLEAVWGVDANTLIYGNDEDTIPELNTSYTELQVSTDTKYQNECWLREGKSTFETSYPSKKQKVRLRNFVLQYVPLYNFCNNTLSNIASELVYVGNGSPCYNCPDNDMKTRGKIKLTTTSGICNCNVKISDKPFNNGNIGDGGTSILSINIPTGTETTFEMENKSKGNYYIYISNLTNTNPITIDKFEIKNNK